MLDTLWYPISSPKRKPASRVEASADQLASDLLLPPFGSVFLRFPIAVALPNCGAALEAVLPRYLYKSQGNFSWESLAVLRIGKLGSQMRSNWNG